MVYAESSIRSSFYFYYHSILFKPVPEPNAARASNDIYWHYTQASIVDFEWLM